MKEKDIKEYIFKGEFESIMDNIYEAGNKLYDRGCGYMDIVDAGNIYENARNMLHAGNIFEKLKKCEKFTSRKKYILHGTTFYQLINKDNYEKHRIFNICDLCSEQLEIFVEDWDAYDEFLWETGIDNTNLKCINQRMPESVKRDIEKPYSPPAFHFQNS